MPDHIPFYEHILEVACEAARAAADVIGAAAGTIGGIEDDLLPALSLPGRAAPTEPRSPIRRWERDACSCRRTSKIQRRVVDNFFHHEKRSGLPDTGQRDEFLAVQTVEIGHVTDPDLEEIVEISRNQMAIEHESQAANGGLELGKALGRRAVEHDADHDKGSAIDLLRRDLGPHAGDIAFGEQALGTPVTGGGADIHPLRELGVTETAIAVQEAENFLVDPV